MEILNQIQWQGKTSDLVCPVSRRPDLLSHFFTPEFSHMTLYGGPTLPTLLSSMEASSEGEKAGKRRDN